MRSSEWKNITPDPLIDAVAHIRERFEENEFKFDFLTQQKCYKELHPVAPTKTPAAVFKDYMDVYEAGSKELIDKQFDELLEIGLANVDLLKEHPIVWAQLHIKFLIDGKPERVKLWTKNVCDQQPMSKGTTPEDMDEFVHWRAWRAPKFIVMQPSANLPYNPASAWERENEDETQKYLHALSERFLNGLVFHLNRIAGEAHVKLAKKGMRIQQPSVPNFTVKNTVDDRSDAAGHSPVAFISYSWDSEAHKKWVLALAHRLQAEGGVQIVLDRWHLQPGDDKTVFMEKSVTKSKFVILVCTPDYAQKANSRKGGVGYEATIITGELAEKINERKFIPALRDGNWNASLPVWIKTKIGVDLRNNPYSEEQYQNLLGALHNEPPEPPPIGPKPVFKDSSPVEQSSASTAPAARSNFRSLG